MSLVLWLPLINDYHNQGLNNYEISTLGTISWPSGGKLGATCLQAGNANQTSNGLRIEDTFTDLLNGNYTVAVWVKPLGNHVHYNGSIFSSGNWNTAKKRWAFGVNQTNTKVDVLCSDYNTYIDCSVPINEWTHLVCTCGNDRVVKLYKNGSYIGSLNRSTSNTFDSDNVFTCIGRESYANGYFSFNGCLQDFRLYDEALDLLEVKKLSQGLIAHYPLNDSYIELTTNLITTEDGLSATCYNGATSKYSYGTTTDMYKEVTTFDGKKGTKVHMGTDGLAAFPYVYVNNMYTSDGTNSPAYKTLSFDYYTNIGTSIRPYKLGSGSGTATYRIINSNGTSTGTGTDAVSIPIIKDEWNHIEITFHGTTAADSQWGYIQNYPSHTSNTSNFWFFANMQLETKDHATPYAGVGQTRNDLVIYDSSGYCYNGTCTNNFSVYPDSPRYDASTYFEDYTRIITCPINLPPPSEITLSCWIKTTIKSTAKGGYHIMFNNNGNGTSYEMSIYGSAGQFRSGFYINGSRSVANVGPDICDGKWHMVAISYDGDAIKRYVDGILISTVTLTGTLSSTLGSIVMGNLSNGAYGSTQLYQSDVRVYVTALSDDDITALYQNSAYISSKKTIHAYEFMEK